MCYELPVNAIRTKIFKRKTLKLGFFLILKKIVTCVLHTVHLIKVYIKVSKNILTFFIYVHVCAIKYDKMKECGALMMNSLNWNQSKDFLSNDTQKNYVHYTY